MMQNRRGVALVTGGARRIGAAIARDLGTSGWDVIIHFNNSRAYAEKLASEIEDAGGRCRYIQADLTVSSQVENLMAAAADLFGSVDVLINNAALFSYDNIQKIEMDVWRRHIDTNLTAPIFLSTQFAKRLPEQKVGVIINMLDQKIYNINPDFLSYTISKCGLRDLTTILSMAFRPRIRVCGIAPNVTLISGKQTPGSFRKSTKVTPLGYSSTVAEIVTAVQFILTTPSFNGQVLTIDGGESLTGRQRDVAFETG